MIVDVDFRSEFEIARSTSGYKAVLQNLPYIFVGKTDRLIQIVAMASEAARQSLKKKGMHIAPWRKAEYMKSKWLSPHARLTNEEAPPDDPDVLDLGCEGGELDLIFGEDVTISSPAPMTWQLPAIKPKSLERGNKVVVTGLASLLKEKH